MWFAGAVALWLGAGCVGDEPAAGQFPVSEGAVGSECETHDDCPAPQGIDQFACYSHLKNCGPYTR